MVFSFNTVKYTATLGIEMGRFLHDKLYDYYNALVFHSYCRSDWPI